jgi:hypothetical protein
MMEEVANEVLRTVHAGVEEDARAKGVAVLTTSITDDPTRERDAVRALAHPPCGRPDRRALESER